MPMTYELFSSGLVQVHREATVIMDGQESLRLVDEVYNPGDDISAKPQEVQDLCNAWWGPEGYTAWVFD